MLAKMETRTKANNKKFQVSHHAKTEVNHELMATMKASHERIEALIDVSLDVMEAHLEKVKEPTSVEMTSAVVHEVHKEDAAVKPVGALRKWHRNWNLAIRRHKEPKEQTQGNGGYQKKSATARRGITHHAGVARCKGHCHQGYGRDNDAPRTQKGREETSGKT
jgi:hypothetical protein